MNHDGKDRHKRAKGRLIIGSVVLLLMGLGIYLTHDILVTNFLAYRICHSEPQPKTFIKKTVEYPESIYWEDNIYPGFDEKDRLLMIRNYLDGVHLKVMGLNAPDGSAYIFTAIPEDWQISREIKAGKIHGNYYDMLKEEARAIAAKGQHVSREKLPAFRYSVVFNPVPLTTFQNRYLYSDEVMISDEKANEVIAYNRRLMRFYYKFEFQPVGGCISMTKLHSRAIYGLPILYGLDDQAILKYVLPNNLVTNYKCRRSLKSRL